MNNPQRNQLVYDGSTQQIYGIWFINFMLKIVTLGIYSFWGKTRLRRYVVGSFSLLNDRFSYTGTGEELFKGFLIALPFIIALYAPFIIWNQDVYPLVNLMFIPILVAVYAGIFSSLRYRYSRTTWRGVRGKLTGSAWSYALLRIGRTILNVLTLGYLIPYSDMKTQAYITENSYFGSAKAEFKPNAGELVKTNILTLLLFFPTFGMSRFWYKAARNRHIYAATRIGGLKLECSQTGGSLLRMVLGNVLIVIITFGLGVPIIIQRSTKYFANTLTIIGDINTSGISQAEGKIASSGEGIDGAIGETDFGFM